MAELDIEQLIEIIKNAACHDGPWDQTLLTKSEWQWLSTALEDRERLRELVQRAIDHTSVAPEDVEADSLPYMWINKAEVAELRAALEGRNG